MSEMKSNVVVLLEEVCEIVRQVSEAEIDEGEGLARCLIIADTHKEKRSLVTSIYSKKLRWYKAPTRSDAGASASNDDPSAIIDEFNEKYAVVNENGVAFVYERVDDEILERKVLRRITFENLKKLYLNRSVSIMLPNGRTISQNIADFWLTNADRRQYLGGPVFDPTNKHTPDQWNLWDGFSVEPKQGDWSPMQRHIEEAICGGNQACSQYLYDWMARLFQFPHKPAEVAVVCRGLKGAGKGIVARWIKRGFGQHGVHITNARHLVGNFNAHLRDCVFLFADEAFFAGDKQHEGVLKGLITEETVVIEAKRKDVIEVMNMLHIWMASNSDYVVPATADERRYLVLDVKDHRLGQLAYFKAIDDQMKNGGLAAMIYDMLHRDITRFNVRDVPQTEALAEQKTLNFDSVNQWLYEVLCRGVVWESQHGTPVFSQWMEFTSVDLLWASYEEWFAKHHKGYKTSRVQFKKSLDKIYRACWGRPRGGAIVGEIERLPQQSLSLNLDQVAPIWKDRPYGYRFGALIEARGAFQDHHKITGEWGVLRRVDEWGW